MLRVVLRLATICALVLATDALVLGGVGATTPRACVSMMAKTKTKMVKVLLSTNVEGLGLKGEVVEVKSIYAQNVLVPKKLGAVPTKAMLEQLAEEQAAAAAAAKAAKANAEADKAKLQQRYGKGLVYEVQVDKSTGLPLSPVTSANVAAELASAAKVKVEAESIQMDEITMLDSAVATVQLHPEVSMLLKVVVEKSKITFS
jgi:large subunit ribosomal protein L9